ncbi:hypothetical protein [Spongiactinospora sp. TRM90649]|nr:hypothetical protein [Spongiactinospora sp. TRM90649]MDF5758173.1 hypothetical protein [Spongiactinospora sp. TRM90649]
MASSITAAATFALPCPGDEGWGPDGAEESAQRLPRINRYMSELRGNA